jgi:prophage antirepressor-like protein
MSEENKIQLFQNQNVRTHWDEENEKWFFSVQNIVQILSESNDVKQYIKKMRSRNTELSNNWGTICTPLEMIAADTEQLLRLIQSIPSKKAEPFKQWLAKVGAERIEETEDNWI